MRRGAATTAGVCGGVLRSRGHWKVEPNVDVAAWVGSLDRASPSVTLRRLRSATSLALAIRDGDVQPFDVHVRQPNRPHQPSFVDITVVVRTAAGEQPITSRQLLEATRVLG